MGLALLVAAIAFSTLLLAYFYLVTESPQWPPDGVDEPGLTLGAVATVAIVAAAVAIGRARRDIEGGETARLRVGLVVGGALIAAGGVVQVVELVGLDFSAQDHAYGSIFYLMAIGMVALALAGLVIVGVVLAAALRNEFTSRRHAAVINAHRYAVVLASLWVIGAATLYLAPRLT
jgi:cytochrome c oxidase subunit I+III